MIIGEKMISHECIKIHKTTYDSIVDSFYIKSKPTIIISKDKRHEV